MKNNLHVITNYFLPHGIQTHEEQRKAVLLVNFVTVLSLFSFVYLILCYFTNIIIGVWTNLIMFPLCLAALFVFKYTKSFIRSSNIAVFGLTLGIAEGVLFSGNPQSPAIPWLITAPSCAFLLGNKKAGIGWTIVVSILILVFGLIRIFNVPVPYLFPAHLNNYILTFTLIAVTIFFSIIISIYDNTRTAATNALALEKAKSEKLLLNILPEAVAEELKEKSKYEARQYDNTTVLFTDFVGFTKISEKLPAKQLVEEIDTCFTTFDEIIERNGLEKIKTIGDSYMAVGGVPEVNNSHAKDAVTAAIEIRDFVENRKTEKLKKGELAFDIRIGIHTGSVVAGIVGTKKFAYDIWGDTVNTASRMESSCDIGKINISNTTYELIQADFDCTHRGKLTAKNKGEIDMYYVNSALFKMA